MRRIMVSIALILAAVLPSAAQEPCSAARPVRLTPGRAGTVLFTDGSPLNVRLSSSRSADIVARIPEGQSFHVLNAATCNEADGINWFPVQFGEEVGWIAEAVDGDYLVEPAAGITSLTDALGGPRHVLAARIADSEYALLNTELYPLVSIVTPLNSQFPTLEFGDEAIVRGDALFVYTLDSGFFPAVVAFRESGDPVTYKQPARPGWLVGFMPSPDASRVAWLFDLTGVPPTFDGCDAAAGCVGRVYELVITGADGAETSIEGWVVGEPFPYVELHAWLDGRIILERHMWGVASGTFPIMGGGLVAVNDQTGVHTELTVLTDQDEVMHPLGEYIARVTTGKNLIDIEGFDVTAGRSLRDFRGLAGYLSFSPDGRYLAYSLYLLDGSDIAATEVWLYDTATAETTLLANYPVARPQVVAYVSAWLSDDVVVLTHDQTLSVVQLSTGKSVYIERVYVGLGDEGKPVEAFIGTLE